MTVLLQVASMSMEAQDAHEDILVTGQVGHSLDVPDMGMLQKKQARSACSLYKCIELHTSMYQYVLLHTGIYLYVPAHTSGA